MAFSIKCGMGNLVAELLCDNDLASKGSTYKLWLIWMTTWNHTLLSILVAKEDLTKSLIISLRHHERPISNFNFRNSYKVVKTRIAIPLSSFKSIFIFSTSVSGNYKAHSEFAFLHRWEHESTKSRSPSLIQAFRAAYTFPRLLGIL